MVITGQVVAETKILSRDVTVKGDSVRAPLVSNLVLSYFASTKVVPIISDDLGEYVIVSGSGGEEKIHFTPKLIKKLEKLSADPRAGQGLMDICPSQARSLIKAVGQMVVDVKDPDELRASERVSFCDQNGCFNGRVVIGSYQTLQPFEGIRLVSNTGNHRYPENSITFKVEYHQKGHPGWPYGTGWGPTIVLRNVTMENPMELVQTNSCVILPYLEKTTNLKRGQPGNEGDSCYEVVILRDGTVYKDESPPEAPFFK